MVSYFIIIKLEDYHLENLFLNLKILFLMLVLLILFRNLILASYKYLFLFRRLMIVGSFSFKAKKLLLSGVG